jgi:hypothetical protein
MPTLGWQKSGLSLVSTAKHAAPMAANEPSDVSSALATPRSNTRFPRHASAVDGRFMHVLYDVFTDTQCNFTLPVCWTTSEPLYPEIKKFHKGGVAVDHNNENYVTDGLSMLYRLKDKNPPKSPLIAIT